MSAIFLKSYWVKLFFGYWGTDTMELREYSIIKSLFADAKHSSEKICPRGVVILVIRWFGDLRSQRSSAQFISSASTFAFKYLSAQRNAFLSQHFCSQFGRICEWARWISHFPRLISTEGALYIAQPRDNHPSIQPHGYPYPSYSVNGLLGYLVIILDGDTSSMHIPVQVFWLMWYLVIW